MDISEAGLNLIREREGCVLTQRRLHEVLNYDQDSGIFIWKIQTSHRIQVGDKAGVVTKRGYISIGIDGYRYYAHQLAFLYMTGELVRYIDHANGDGLDNRFFNLRPCSVSQNASNSKLRLNNRSGVKGVYWDKRKNKWAAQITHNKRTICLGRFSTISDAKTVREATATELFGAFARAC